MNRFERPTGTEAPRDDVERYYRTLKRQVAATRSAIASNVFRLARRSGPDFLLFGAVRHFVLAGSTTYPAAQVNAVNAARWTEITADLIRSPVAFACWTEDGNALAYAIDGIIHVCDQRGRRSSCRAHRAVARLLAAGSEGRIASVAGDECVHVCERYASPFEFKDGSSREFLSVAWILSGTAVAAGDKGGALFGWDIVSRRPIHLPAGYGDPIYAMCWCDCQDGPFLAWADAGGRVALWSTRGGESQLQPLHSREVDCLAWNAQRGLLASGGRDRNVCIWDVKNRRLVKSIGHNFQITGLAFSMGRFLLTRTSDGGFHSFDCETWFEVDHQRAEKLPQLRPGVSCHPTLPVAALFGAQGKPLEFRDVQSVGPIQVASSVLPADGGVNGSPTLHTVISPSVAPIPSHVAIVEKSDTHSGVVALSRSGTSEFVGRNGKYKKRMLTLLSIAATGGLSATEIAEHMSEDDSSQIGREKATQLLTQLSKDGLVKHNQQRNKSSRWYLARFYADSLPPR